MDPWTLLAKFKLKSEEALGAIPGLNYVIVRPAIIYGIGDKQGISKLGRGEWSVGRDGTILHCSSPVYTQGIKECVLRYLTPVVYRERFRRV